MASEKQGISMTVGSPIRHILRFCIPLLIGNIFQQLYNMIDTMVVGKGVGKDALAAVGSTGSFSFLILGFVLGVCSGFCVPVSRCFGAGDYRKMRRTIANAIMLGAVVAVVVTVLTVIFTAPILRLMKTPENIMADSYRYIVIVFAGIPTLMLYNLLAGILRAVGDSKMPLIFLIIGVTSNIVADFLLVMVIPLGVAGAAIATVFSQLLAGLLCLLFIMKKFRFVLPEKGDWKFSASLARQLLTMGLPMGLQFSITAIGALVLQRAVNPLGSDAIAAMTAGNKIENIFIVPMESFGITLATYCGQNLGAGRIDRIYKGVMQTAMLEIAYSVLLAIPMFFIGNRLAYLFIDSAEIAPLLPFIDYFLKSHAIFYIPLSMIFLFRNAIQGLGFSFPAMFAGLLELAGRAGTALSVVGHFGFYGASWASPVAWILADLFLIPFFFVKINSLRKTVTPCNRLPDEKLSAHGILQK